MSFEGMSHDSQVYRPLILRLESRLLACYKVVVVVVWGLNVKVFGVNHASRYPRAWVTVVRGQ